MENQISGSIQAVYNHNDFQHYGTSCGMSCTSNRSFSTTSRPANFFHYPLSILTIQLGLCEFQVRTACCILIIRICLSSWSPDQATSQGLGKRKGENSLWPFFFELILNTVTVNQYNYHWGQFRPPGFQWPSAVINVTKKCMLECRRLFLKSGGKCNSKNSWKYFPTSQVKICSKSES